MYRIQNCHLAQRRVPAVLHVVPYIDDVLLLVKQAGLIFFSFLLATLPPAGPVPKKSHSTFFGHARWKYIETTTTLCPLLKKGRMSG